MHLHDIRHTHDPRDPINVAEKIEIELVVERRINRVRCRDHEERVTVRGGTHDCLGADVTTRSRAVFDNELLAEPLRQPWSDESRGDVGAPTGCKTHDDTHRPRWI